MSRGAAVVTAWWAVAVMALLLPGGSAWCAPCSPCTATTTTLTTGRSSVVLGMTAKGTLSSKTAAPSSVSSSSLDTNTRAATRKLAVLVCPAQFCVPADYEALWHTLEAQIAEEQRSGSTGSGNLPPLQLAKSSQVAPLSRWDWIKVARQLPTREFFEAKLPVRPTLYWYFEAIESALADILAKEGPDVQIAIVGHSIGGWVARAYLGGLSRSASATFRLAVERCTTLLTLGTPHISPEEALVDQTRGLLAAIEADPKCSPQSLLGDSGIRCICVASQAIGGSWNPLEIERFVAAASYAPLTGRWNNVLGDGIVPIDLALLPEPATSVILDRDPTTDEEIHHLHVLPTPYNLWDPLAKSIPLSFSSYVSPGVVSQWVPSLLGDDVGSPGTEQTRQP